MLSVPRQEFVPDKYRDQAYNDNPLPIGEGQTISQPYIVALMTELLEVQPGDKILEIGTGSGYQAAVLAEMGAEVYSIEIISELAERARKALASTGYEVRTRVGDGYFGWEQYAPFDGIIVTAAPDHVPPPLRDQLGPKGKMVMVLLGSANRDEEWLPDASHFDVTRKLKGHIGFGFGVHFCLGASLARLEARVALEELFRRCKHLKRTTSNVEWIDSLLLRGPKALPLQFDA